MKRLAILLAVFLFAVTPLFAGRRQFTFVPYRGYVIVDEWMHYENRNTVPTTQGTHYHDIFVRVQGKTADGQVVADTVVQLESWRGEEMFPGMVIPAYDHFTDFGGTSGLKVLQRTIQPVSGTATISGDFPKDLVWAVHSSIGTHTGGGAHTSTFEMPTIIPNVTLGAPPTP